MYRIPAILFYLQIDAHVQRRKKKKYEEESKKGSKKCNLRARPDTFIMAIGHDNAKSKKK